SGRRHPRRQDEGPQEDPRAHLVADAHRRAAQGVRDARAPRTTRQSRSRRRVVLQSVSFPVAGTEVLAILHLPATDPLGGVALLPDRGMQYEHPDLLLGANALADAGVAALRFDWRSKQPTLDDATSDVVAALRLLKAHPALPGAIGLAGFGFGA